MALIVVLLAVLAAVIALPLIALSRRRSDSGTNSPAAIISYLILVAASIVATNSFSSLVQSVLPGDVTIFDDVSDIALTLSTLIVSGLVWGSVWWALEKRRTGPSAGRGLYLSLTAAIAMTVVAFTVIGLLAALLGLDEYEAPALADLLCFGALWILVEWWRRRDDTLGEVRSFWGSLLGVAMSGSGLGILLATSLQAILGSREVLIGESDLSEGLRWGSIVLAVGAVYFTWFWLRDFARTLSSFRTFYAAIVTIVAWFIALHAFAVVAYQLLESALGLSESTSSPIAVASATTIVAALIYWHHRPFLGQTRTEPVRVVEYLFGGYSLVVLAGTFSFLLTQILTRLFSSDTVLQDDNRVLLATLVSLGIAGAATARYWGRALRLRESDSPARRVALLILFFASAVTGAVALIFVLFTLLRSILAGGGEELAEPLSGAVPITLVAAAVCWHIVALRRQLRPRTGVSPVRTPELAGRAVSDKIVTVVAADPGPLPSLLAGMRFLRRADQVGIVTADVAPAIVAAIEAIEGRAVLVTVNADGYTVVPLV